MAASDNVNADFYAVLGLTKDCSDVQIKTAYKKLALRWHPDRCAATGNSKSVEEAKKKFQAIQEAYSVLSDNSKRFLYDLGVYDGNDDDDDDDDNGMGDFLNEMAVLMRQNQNQTTEDVLESFEELKTMFNDMFQDDLEGINSSSQTRATSSLSPSMFATHGETPVLSNKRNLDLNLTKSETENSSKFDINFQGFSVGAGHQGSHREGGCAPGEYKSRRSGRKQKVASSHDVSSGNNAGIST